MALGERGTGETSSAGGKTKEKPKVLSLFVQEIQMISVSLRSALKSVQEKW